VQRTTILAFSLLSLGSLLPIACTQDFNYYQATSAGGGTTSSSTTTSTTSTGGGMPCTTDGDCDDMNPCSVDKCDPGTKQCAYSNVPDGPVPGFTDTVKDCKTQQCVGGSAESVAADNDVPDNTNPCVTLSCDKMNVVTTNVMIGTSCGQDMQQCDGNGNCVGCNKDQDCPDPGACKSKFCDTNHVCSPKSAQDGSGCNANGGQVCLAGACVVCIDSGDCNASQSEVCTNNMCVTSCGDGSKDGLESDVDCGGICSTKCGTNKNCNGNTDCSSKVCTGGKCQAPSCTDTVKNGSETDVDCGGATCDGQGKTCADGKSCGADADCMSGHCINNKCASGCADGAKDGTETDVDCGGATCVAQGKTCGDGKMCMADTDCTSGKCTGGTCAMPTCMDSVQNGNETDVDCGGGTCPKCANGDKCAAGTDCTSGFCYVTGGGAGQKTCHADQCTDGMKDGTETDTDCGGSNMCARCGSNKSCMMDSDCQSGLSCNPGQKKCQ
jgi:hypothetical protein